MFLAIDVGGTKTLLACFDEAGTITSQIKFATPEIYQTWLEAFKEALPKLQCKDFRACTIGIPGRIDHKTGTAVGYGTLRWQVASVQADMERLLKAPVIVENDAKLAGLSEANLIRNEFKNVLYVTVGTGIGTAVITDGKLDPAFLDSEGGQMMVDFRGQAVQWEDIASGSAIVKRFGKKASDIADAETWKIIGHDFALGLINLIAVMQPQVIVLGGGVDTNFEKFVPYLQEALQRYATPLVPIPPIRKAKRPEEAVIYGCYQMTKEHYGTPTEVNVGG